jgi:hypothetical protein
MFTRKTIIAVLAACYAFAAGLASWHVIADTRASTQAIEKILTTYNLKNEGAKSLEQFTDAHPLLGLFASGPIKKQLDLPSAEEASDALHSEVRQHLKDVRHASSQAAWWSWFLLNLSVLFVVIVMAVEHSLNTRAVLFSLTTVSVFCFVIGILAPAMVIWTTPTIPMATGNLEFVLQHQVRGIAAIIKELITSGHWVIGGFLLLFSIVTPLTKASLTFFATGCPSKTLNYKIGILLHSIGKWSMADVFVAGILLALYALKAQEATKSIPCLGLYYFIGYCLLSMTTTELLTHSGLVADHPQTREIKLGKTALAGIFAAALGFIAISSAYTYQQYTLNTKQQVKAEASPLKLNNSDLVLPAHK